MKPTISPSAPEKGPHCCLRPPRFQNGPGITLSVRLIGLAMLLLSTIGAIVAEPTAPSAEPLAAITEPYPPAAFAAIGSSFAQSSHLPELGWDEAQIAAFIEGVRAAFRGKGYPFDDTARLVSAEMGRRVQQIVAREKQQTSDTFAQPGRLEQYMKETRKRLGLQQSDSGLGYRIEPGRGGIRPRPGDTIVITSIATAADGTTKLPQLTTPERVRVKMADLLPGFMEGLQMMTIDSHAIFVLPPTLSFGEGEWPQGVDRGTPLVFWVTLHEVISAPVSP